MEILSQKITERTIVLQKLAFNHDPKTLADLYSLCGTLQWVRPWLGLTTEDLASLSNLLKGGEELSSPRTLTPEAKAALENLEKYLEERQAHWCNPELPFKFIVLGRLPHLHGLVFQWDQDQRDPLLIVK